MIKTKNDQNSVNDYVVVDYYRVNYDLLFKFSNLIKCQKKIISFFVKLLDYREDCLCKLQDLTPFLSVYLPLSPSELVYGLYIC